MISVGYEKEKGAEGSWFRPPGRFGRSQQYYTGRKHPNFLRFGSWGRNGDGRGKGMGRGGGQTGSYAWLV